jgi:hypothetical protein
MKKLEKHQKKPLHVSSETIRKLSVCQITEVVGGSLHSTAKATVCINIFCVN